MDSETESSSVTSSSVTEVTERSSSSSVVSLSVLIAPKPCNMSRKRFVLGNLHQGKKKGTVT